MRVPFQIPAEGIEEYDKTGSEIQGFVQLEEHGETTLAAAWKRQSSMVRS